MQLPSSEVSQGFSLSAWAQHDVFTIKGVCQSVYSSGTALVSAVCVLQRLPLEIHRICGYTRHI